jgi:hypothetical protein
MILTHTKDFFEKRIAQITGGKKGPDFYYRFQRVTKNITLKIN